ncbi:Slc47a1, partial [Symbiodinium sp. CCMP2456]
EFKAQQPKYAAECLNYENLWKDVSETFKDEEDEEVQTTSKLEADPSTKDPFERALCRLLVRLDA